LASQNPNPPVKLKRHCSTETTFSYSQFLHETTELNDASNSFLCLFDLSNVSPKNIQKKANKEKEGKTIK
jgi:hypothetical protein